MEEKLGRNSTAPGGLLFRNHTSLQNLTILLIMLLQLHRKFLVTFSM